MQEKSGIEEVDANNAQSFLLKVVFAIEHPNMDSDLAILVPRVRLKLYAQPAMALVSALIIAGRHGVGENEEGGAIPARGLQAFQVETVLVVEHPLQAFARDVSLATTVNRIADGHVIGRDRLGDRSCRGADLEKPARNFLPGAYFSKRAVKHRIEVDLQRFLVRAQFWAFVVFHQCHPSCRRHEAMLHVPLLPMYIERMHRLHKWNQKGSRI